MNTSILKLLTTLPLFSLLLACQNTPLQNPQADLKSTILQTIQAFAEEDSVALNQLIHPQTGLYVIHRPGVFDVYSHTDRIDMAHPVPEYFPYSGFASDQDVKFESWPTYDCGEEVWSKYGLYCDTSQRDHLLSRTAENMKKYELEDVPDSAISALKELEQQSRRVVLADEDKGELVFYLTLIDQKWYLTILDRVSGDCSA